MLSAAAAAAAGTFFWRPWLGNEPLSHCGFDKQFLQTKSPVSFSPLHSSPPLSYPLTPPHTYMRLCFVVVHRVSVVYVGIKVADCQSKGGFCCRHHSLLPGFDAGTVNTRKTGYLIFFFQKHTYILVIGTINTSTPIMIAVLALKFLINFVSRCDCIILCCILARCCQRGIIRAHNGSRHERSPFFQ